MRPWDWLCLYRELGQSRSILTHKLCHICLLLCGKSLTRLLQYFYPIGDLRIIGYTRHSLSFSTVNNFDSAVRGWPTPSRYMFIHRWNLSGSIWQSIKKIIIAARHSIVEHTIGCPKFGTQTHLQDQRAGRLGTWVHSAIWSFLHWVVAQKEHLLWHCDKVGLGLDL